MRRSARSGGTATNPMPTAATAARATPMKRRRSAGWRNRLSTERITGTERAAAASRQHLQKILQVFAAGLFGLLGALRHDVSRRVRRRLRAGGVANFREPANAGQR